MLRPLHREDARTPHALLSASMRKQRFSRKGVELLRVVRPLRPSVELRRLQSCRRDPPPVPGRQAPRLGSSVRRRSTGAPDRRWAYATIFWATYPILGDIPERKHTGDIVRDRSPGLLAIQQLPTCSG